MDDISFAIASSSDLPLRSRPGQQPAIATQRLPFVASSIRTRSSAALCTRHRRELSGHGRRVHFVRTAHHSAVTETLASDIDRWLGELGLTPIDRAERDGAHSWDLVLDGRRRRALRVPLILDPAVALVAWVHFAPPMTDNYRKAYRQFLRWNDELPFAKFAISEDERPILTTEVPVAGIDLDGVGGLIARVLAIADLVHVPTLALMNELSRAQTKLAATEPDPAGVALLERYADSLAELYGTEQYNWIRYSRPPSAGS